MKFIDEYRDPKAVHLFVDQLHAITTKPWTLMEVCGGQTHSIVRFGLDTLLPKNISLIHGPGCPVCVTPVEMINKALAIAAMPEVIFCSFGDMLRVPGSNEDLFAVKAKGGDVRIVYSPMDALTLAEQNPERQVVFFAVGFETTAPANAMAAYEAKRRGLRNFSLLVSHVCVPQALETILAHRPCNVNAFLAAGHVCAIMGTEEYIPIVEKYRVPIVITGFEPLDLLQGITMCVAQLEQGRSELENQYERAVKTEGNRNAQAILGAVFKRVDRAWRGIGVIEQSGLALNDSYADFDAERRFQTQDITAQESPLCKSGLVLQGLLRPTECPAFGRECTPETPLGATMVSSEGACATYYRYRKLPQAS